MWAARSSVWRCMFRMMRVWHGVPTKATAFLFCFVISGNACVLGE